MKFNNFAVLILFYSVYLISEDIPPYSAIYNFESEEISISGKREFLKTDSGYEIKFKASNLIASLFFSSRFKILNNEVIPNEYEVRIRPKFLKRDQNLVFNYDEKKISSVGVNEWNINMNETISYDPLNVQIMIRKNVKKGLSGFNFNIIDMEKGVSKLYTFDLIGNEKCIFENEMLNCFVLVRTSEDSDRKVTYFLAKELEYMFVKIIDSSPERVNKLELKELLSLG